MGPDPAQNPIRPDVIKPAAPADVEGEMLQLSRWLATCLLLALSAATALAADDTGIWRYVHPNAKAYFGLDWRRASQSFLADMVRQEVAKAGAAAIPGLELLDSMDRILITSPGDVKSNEEPPMVAVIEGRFDLAKVREAASPSAVSRRYRGVEILEPPKGGSEIQLALVNTHLLLLGDPASLRAVIDRKASSKFTPSGKLLDRARLLARENELWALGAIPLQKLTGDSLPQAAAMLHDIKGFEIGITVEDGLGLQINLDTASEETAHSLATGLSTLVALAAVQEGSSPQFAELSRQIEIAPTGPLLRIAMHMDRRQVEEGFAHARARQQHRPDAIHTSARAPEPPRKKVIRIYGLDEGVREIEY